jgi:hypothetical protein
MKRFLVKSGRFTIFFLIFFAVLNLLYLAIIASTSWDFRKRLESLKFNNPDFDLLALGSSLASDGFDTEALTRNGIKSYNLAMGGSTVRTNYIQLYEYLNTYQKKPQFVLLGLNSYLESFSNPNDSIIHPIVESTMINHKFSLSDMPILKFKWLGFEFLKKLVSSNHRRARLSYGQIKFQKKVKDGTHINNSVILDLAEYKTSFWISEISRLCSENEIRFTIVEMPAFKETRNRSEIGPYIINYNQKGSAELYNMNTIEFCEIFDDSHDWIGNSHLNESGAAKFTLELYNNIKYYQKREWRERFD